MLEIYNNAINKAYQVNLRNYSWEEEIPYFHQSLKVEVIGLESILNIMQSDFFKFPTKVNEQIIQLKMNSSSKDNGEKLDEIRETLLKLSEESDTQDGDLVKNHIEVTRFPSPPGLQWNEITIELMSLENIKINGKEIKKNYTLAELGLLDKRTQKGNRLWVTLAKFAKNFEEIGIKDSEEDKIDKINVSDLRQLLQSIFDIKDDPFEPYKKNHSYKTIFHVILSENLRKHFESLMKRNDTIEPCESNSQENPEKNTDDES